LIFNKEKQTKLFISYAGDVIAVALKEVGDMSPGEQRRRGGNERRRRRQEGPLSTAQSIFAVRKAINGITVRLPVPHRSLC